MPIAFDDESFRRAELMNAGRTLDRDRIVPLHCGILYASPDRDPSEFFMAVWTLLDQDPVWRGRPKIILRATGFESLHRGQLAERDLQGTVFLEPGIPHQEALTEMLDADVFDEALAEWSSRRGGRSLKCHPSTPREHVAVDVGCGQPG